MIQHLAIIMDGNRRWARKQGLYPWLGHKKGAEAIQSIVQFCLQQKINYLSLYAFSLENINRSTQEKSYILNDLLINQSREKINLFLENHVRLRFIGDRSHFSQAVQETVQWLEEQTVHGTALTLNLLFYYGSRQEIFDGVKRLIHKVQAGIISLCSLKPQDLEECLWMANIPDPDLIIRTGGAKRLSNFLLYQAAYSEFYFLDCLWPEITEQHLQNALADFAQTKRNFGQ